MAGILLGLVLWPVVFIAAFAVTRIGRLLAFLILVASLLSGLGLLGGWQP